MIEQTGLAATITRPAYFINKDVNVKGVILGRAGREARGRWAIIDLLHTPVPAFVPAMGIE